MKVRERAVLTSAIGLGRKSNNPPRTKTKCRNERGEKKGASFALKEKKKKENSVQIKRE